MDKNSKISIAVIGSGPSAISATKALVKRGAHVILIDYGEKLEEDRQSKVDSLSLTPRSEWKKSDLEHLGQNSTIHTQAIPKKLVFGSDFIYANKNPYCRLEVNDKEISVSPTLAKGGYSIAWGGAMLPISEFDMSDWPIQRSELDASFNKILNDIPYSAEDDQLSVSFPAYRDVFSKLNISRQSSEFKDDMLKANFDTNPFTFNDSILCGQARLCVRVADDENNKGCTYCGACLTGCPYKSIYSVDQDLDILIKNNKIEYRPGYYVESIKEIDSKIIINAINIKNKKNTEFKFDKVFLAAGALNSTRIMMESLNAYDVTVNFLDSQKFILPIIRFKSAAIEWPKINTFSSIFIEAKFPSIANYWTHMQISSVNDFVLKKLKIEEISGIKWLLMKPGVERLMIAWCGLHSNLSNGFTATLHKSFGQKIMKINKKINPQTNSYIHRFSRKMFIKGLKTKSLFIPKPIISSIGGGNHFGGSMPMRESPNGPFETDKLGTPSGWKKLHIVDATILPSIPSTTIALLIMANADRIANAISFETGK